MAEIHPLPSIQTVFPQAFHEVLGLHESGSLNTHSGHDHLGDLCNRLEQGYSPACACGLAQQIGRSAFMHLLRGKDDLEGLSDQSFRLMPGRQRLKKGLEKLESLIENVFGIPVTVLDEGEVIRLKTIEKGEHDLVPHLEAGFIQEFVHWISGGRPHMVRVSTNDPGWSVRVGKQPLDQ